MHIRTRSKSFFFNLMKCSCDSRHLHSRGNEPLWEEKAVGPELPAAEEKTPASTFQGPESIYLVKKAIGNDIIGLLSGRFAHVIL